MLLAEFGVGQVLWSIFWFFLFLLWIMLVIFVFADIIRSDDLSGLAKALWSIFVIFLPYLGVFVYLIARGSRMITDYDPGYGAAYPRYGQGWYGYGPYY